ncbi:LamG-like jellyroll fold domain-containing protein [Couchioplanes caeruleus]|uniref:LamG-like jellyroll fold domain-containing protein n=1 Tax=Couchioplanes caeruleus TaxID=56438 RepID=UPI0008FF1AC5
MDASGRRLRRHRWQGVLYVDGELKSSTAVPKLWHAGGPVALGRIRWNNANTDFWQGAIGDVRLYQGVLTPEQVMTLFRS